MESLVVNLARRFWCLTTDANANWFDLDQSIKARWLNVSFSFLSDIGFNDPNKITMTEAKEYLELARIYEVTLLSPRP